MAMSAACALPLLRCASAMVFNSCVRSAASVADLAVCKAGREFAGGNLVIHKLGTIRRRVCLNRLLSGSLRHQFRRLGFDPLRRL